jgi:hypothetical protein
MSEWMAVDGLWGTAFKGASNHCFLKMDTSRLLCCWYVQFNFYTKESTIYRKHIETELIINDKWIMNHKSQMNHEFPIFSSWNSHFYSSNLKFFSKTQVGRAEICLGVMNVWRILRPFGRPSRLWCWLFLITKRLEKAT